MKYLNLYYEVEQCHYLLDPVVFFPTSNLLPLIHIDYHIDYLTLTFCSIFMYKQYT